MDKKIIIETACLIGGQHAEVGEVVSADADTADTLVRHGRAKFPDDDKKAAKGGDANGK
jgi:hypothetical protein